MRLRLQFALLTSSLTPALLCAHARQQTSPPDKPYVLHVYANLVQIPALVLNKEFNPLPPLTDKDFLLRLDSGPPFHPTKMHVEGNEPITLTILLDTSGNQDRLIRTFAPALAQLARTSLKPYDHVSILAVDCHLIGSNLDLPTTPEALQSAVEQTLAAPALHNEKNHGDCGRSLHTWDAAAHAIHILSTLPGRRVLLLISSGYDHQSHYTEAEVSHYAGSNSVTIFAIRDLSRFQGDIGFNYRLPFNSDMYFALRTSPEDPFNDLCEANGGLSITVSQQNLVPALERFIAMLHGRYILEFPRPDIHDPGEHRVEVIIPSHQAFTTTAGVGVPLPDEAINSDPNTVPSAPSPAVLGKHHPITSKSKSPKPGNQSPKPQTPQTSRDPYPPASSPVAPAQAAYPPGLTATPHPPSQ